MGQSEGVWEREMSYGVFARTWPRHALSPCFQAWIHSIMMGLVTVRPDGPSWLAGRQVFRLT